MADCTCNQHDEEFTMNTALRGDPTRTLTLRNRFVSAMNARFNKLMRDITTSIVDNDAFGLTDNPNNLPAIRTRSVSQLIAQQAAQPNAFAFPTSTGKIEAFNAWLQQQIDSNILETVPATGIRLTPTGVSNQVPWTNQYIQPAYERGVLRADAELRKIGVEIPVEPINVTIQGPIHVDGVQLAFTRTFTELKGVTTAMDQQISRALAQGLAEGQGPEEIARRINDRVAKIGRTRARMLARTEVIRSHHLANINEYERWGIQGVRVMAEWGTASSGVCAICLDFEAGGPYTLQAIRSLIPAHPNCVTGDTIINAPDIHTLMKTEYTGELFEISLTPEIRITVTPNHMLLTPDGLIMAKFITEGTKILYSPVGEGTFLRNPDDKDNPARIDNIISAFTESGSGISSTMPVTPVDFHGDGKSCQGEVNIIRTNGFLRDSSDTIFGKLPHDDQLAFMGVFDTLFSDGTFAQFFKGAFDTPDGFMGLSRECLAFLRGCLAHAKIHGLASVPWLYSILREDTGDDISSYAIELRDLLHRHPSIELISEFFDWYVDAIRSGMFTEGEPSFTKTVFNRISLSNSIAFGEGLEGFPGHVQAMRVSNVKSFHVDSFPVYDVSTESTGYIANGILSSNCRCVAIPILTEPLPQGGAALLRR